MTGRVVRGLLFDLDGTLVDTAAANYSAYAAALAEAGITAEPEAIAAASAGRHWSEFLPGLLVGADRVVDAASVARRKGELYRRMLGETRLNTTLVAFAASSRPRTRTAIVTTASTASVDALLRQHRVLELFDVIVSGEDVVRRKPDPEAYYLALARLDLLADECLAFEDSEVGMSSALAAGLTVIRVTF